MPLTKDQYGDLLAEIGGGDEIGLPARRERDAAELAALEAHNTQWVVLCLGDAVHQFYRDTLRIVGAHVRQAAPTPIESAILNWHIVSFGRFAAAFHLLAHAYYFEAMMLARDLWEVAVSLAALQRGAVTLEELMDIGDGTAREIRKRSQAVDTKIGAALIWQNPRLGENGRAAVGQFLKHVNLATHKSRLHVGLNLHRLMAGHGVPIFPFFDMERAAGAYNLLYPAAWSLISTLPYLSFVPFSPGWTDRYARVQLAFEEGVGRGPADIAQAWSEVVRAIFVVA